MPTPTYWPSLAKSKIIELLQAALVDDVDDADDSKVGIVTLGKYLDNPARKRIVVEVYENDPDGTDWDHHVETSSNNENRRTLGGTIGGQRNHWYRRFVFKINVLMRGANQAESDTLKGAVMSRIERVLLDYPTLEDLEDDGSERAYEGHVVRENGRQGGDDRTPIWRHKIWIEFRTIRRG